MLRRRSSPTGPRVAAFAGLVTAAALLAWLPPPVLRSETTQSDRATPPGLPSPPLVETAEVRLNLLEVIVLDRKGLHVRGLSPSAFTLAEKQREIPIATFDEIDVAAATGAKAASIAAEAVETAPAEPPPAPAPSATPPPTAETGPPAPRSAGDVARIRAEGNRWFVLLFDGYNNPSPLRFSQARRAAKAWLDRTLRPNDFVAVYEMTPFLSAITSFSRDPAEISLAIDKVRIFPGESMGSEFVEKTLEQGVSVPRSVLEQQLMNAATFAGDLLAAERDQFYRNMTDLAQAMSGLEGTKAILMFSGGFPLTRNRASSSAGGFTPQFGTMLREMARTGIRVFSFDAGEEGGFADASVASNSRILVDQLGLGTEWLDTLQIGAQVDSVNAHQEILKVVGFETGGRFFGNRAYRDNMEAATDDLDHYYLIGYKPPKEEENPYVSIRVRVKDPDLRVVARRGRFASAAPPSPPSGAVPARAASTLASSSSAATVPPAPLRLSCRTLFYPGRDGKTLLSLAIRVDGPIPTFRSGPDGYILDATLEISASAGGEEILRGTREIRSSIPAEAALSLVEGMHLRDALLLPPSAVDLSAELRLNGLERSGGCSESLVVPERPADRFGLTDLALFAPADRAPLVFDTFRKGVPVLNADAAVAVPFPDPFGPDAAGRPAAYLSGAIPATVPLLAHVRVQKPPPAEQGKPSPLRMDWELVPREGEPLAPPITYRRLQLADQGESLDVMAALDLSEVPAGTYVLRLTTENRSTGAVDRRFCPVEISRP